MCSRRAARQSLGHVQLLLTRGPCLALQHRLGFDLHGTSRHLLAMHQMKIPMLSVHRTRLPSHWQRAPPKPSWDIQLPLSRRTSACPDTMHACSRSTRLRARRPTRTSGRQAKKPLSTCATASFPGLGHYECNRTRIEPKQTTHWPLCCDLAVTGSSCVTACLRLQAVSSPKHSIWAQQTLVTVCSIPVDILAT